MAASLFHHRRSERFGQLLDQAGGKGRRHSRTSLDDELAAYVALGRSISAKKLTAHARPEADFRSSLRAMLVATAEREGIGSAAGKAGRRVTSGRVYLGASAQSGSTAESTSTKRRPVVGSRRTRGAIIIGVAVGTLALSGMSMASGDAMPGDPLYGVKRSTEGAQLALAGSDIDRGQAYLGFARNRGREAAALRGDPSRRSAALGDMDSETAMGVKLLTSAALNRRDATAIDPVDAFVRTQRPVVAGLVANLAGSAQDRAAQSLQLIDEVAQRAAGLRAALHCAAVNTGVRTGSDFLGPVPPSCPPPTGSSGYPKSGSAGH